MFHLQPTYSVSNKQLLVFISPQFFCHRDGLKETDLCMNFKCTVLDAQRRNLNAQLRKLYAQRRKATRNDAKATRNDARYNAQRRKSQRATTQ